MSLILIIFLAMLGFSCGKDQPIPSPLEISTQLPDGGLLRLLFVPGFVEKLTEGDSKNLKFLHQISNSTKPVVIKFVSLNQDIFKLERKINFTLTIADSRSWPTYNSSNVDELMNIANSSFGNNITMTAIFLGRSSIVVEVMNTTNGLWIPMKESLPVSVIRRLRWIDRVFTIIVVCLVMFANLGMGTQLELKVIRKVIRRPLAPAIGFLCQYTVMPLVSFGVGTLLNLPAGILLGYFAMGCAPGGGASNFYSYLLGGDVSLSITMTLVSTVAALGMVPLWLFTLGQYILRNQPHTVTIPFQNILVSLVTMLVPVALGYLIKRKLPKVAKIINKALKPFVLCLIIFFFTVGVYANLYIFRMFSPIVVLAGCLLPYCGFFFGGLISFLARLKLPFIKTVSLETGIQNTGVPILLLKFSLPQPDSDISIVGPIAASMFTPLPLYIIIISLEIYRRCCKKKDEEEKKKEDEENDEKDVKDQEVGESLLSSDNEKVENGTNEKELAMAEINGSKASERDETKI